MRITRVIRRAIGLLPVVLLFVTTIPSTSTAQQQGEIRAVYLSPDAPALDVYIGDTTSAAATNLGYGSATAALVRAATTHRLIMTRTGMPGARVIDANVQVQAGRRTNVLAINSFAQIEAHAISFDPTLQPVADTAYVRIVHAAAGLGNVDIRVKDASGAVRTFAAFPYQTNTQFFPIPAGGAEVWFLAPGTGTVIAKFRGTMPGDVYASILASGSSDDLHLHVLIENSTPQQNPMTEFTTFVDPPPSSLRVVHAVADGPAIDIYFNGTVAADSLSFLDASVLVGIDSGRYSVGVTPAGQPLGNAVLSTTLDLNADTAYTFVAVGSLAGAKLNALTLRRRLDATATDSTILLRVLHAGYGAGDLDVVVSDSRGGQTPITGMSFETSTDYMSIPAGDLTVKVSKIGGGTTQIISTGTLLPGTIATLVMTRGGSLRTHILLDNDTVAQQPMREFAGVTRGRLRLVHTSPDGPAVDAYLYNDTTLTTGIAFRDASPAPLVYPEHLSIRIAPAGMGIGAAVIDSSLEIRGDTLTTVFAVGTVADLTLGAVVLETIRADTPAPGTSHVRLLQACPDCGPLDIGITPGSGPTQGINAIVFRQSTEYLQIPPGPINVKIYADGGTDPILDVSGTLPSDEVVTAIVTGTVAGGSLGVNLLVDSQDGEQRPMILLTRSTTSVWTDPTSPNALSVVPNPAPLSTTISYMLPRTTSIRIEVFDLLGRVVAVAEPGPQHEGPHGVVISTAGIPSGRYVVALHAADGTPIGHAPLTIAR